MNKLDLYKGTLKAIKEYKTERDCELENIRYEYNAKKQYILTKKYKQSMDDVNAQLKLILESVDIPGGMQRVNLGSDIADWHISIERDGRNYTAFCDCGWCEPRGDIEANESIKPLTSLAEIDCSDCIELYLKSLE
jgi:hypothetical protein